MGANNTAFCLRRLGVDAIVLPTTLMGRHPGWGPPGGEVTSAHILSDMWSGIAAQNITIDAVITGYMGSCENVALANQIISDIKLRNPSVLVIVDPVMGDAGKLYVPVEVAEDIMTALTPKADIITPNVWEFSQIVQKDFNAIEDVKTALLDYSGCALVTSVKHHGRIGALSYHPKGLTYISHKVFDQVPNGGGDAITGLLTGHVMQGKSEEEAALRAVSSVFAMMRHAVSRQTREFPLTACQDQIKEASLLGMDRLHG